MFPEAMEFAFPSQSGELPQMANDSYQTNGIGKVGVELPSFSQTRFCAAAEKLAWSGK